VEPLTDLFLYDLKLMDDALHRQYTGCGNGQILANYVHLIQSGKTVHVRVPVMEEVNDTAQNWAMLEALLHRYPPAALRFLPYHTLGAGKYAGLRMNAVRFTPPSAERLEQLAARFSALGILVEKL
jgi:pyruvate formate lyase activating enzyme